jgi:hypothetical protein
MLERRETVLVRHLREDIMSDMGTLRTAIPIWKRRNVFLVLVAITVLACRGRDRVLPHDSSAVPLPLPAAALVAEPARSVCDSVAAIWRGESGVLVTTQDTTSRVMAAENETLGCQVRATAPNGGDTPAVRPLYWARADALGWTPLWQFGADGPDGGTLTYQRDTVLCEVDEMVDGGDDADSTYVRSPETSEQTFCWGRVGPPLTVPKPPDQPAPPAPGTVTGVLIRPGKMPAKRP